MQVTGQVNADWGSFQHSCVFETGLSYFHRMTVTVLQTTFHKLQPRKVNYSDYNKSLTMIILESIYTLG